MQPIRRTRRKSRILHRRILHSLGRIRQQRIILTQALQWITLLSMQQRVPLILRQEQTPLLIVVLQRGIKVSQWIKLAIKLSKDRTHPPRRTIWLWNSQVCLRFWWIIITPQMWLSNQPLTSRDLCYHLPKIHLKMPRTLKKKALTLRW